MTRLRIRTTTAADAARAILDAMFRESAPATPVTAPAASIETAGTSTGRRLAAFQQAAVLTAEQILARRRGVLIADPVGMGKTLVGAALAEASLLAGKHTLVVVPASLRRQWTAALRHLRNRNDQPRAELHLVSHTDLSRDNTPDTDRPFGRVIVDEAHGFRNPNTRRYAAIARVTRSADVVLLTATPINNSLLDLYFLIRLFAGDGAFADLGTPDLARLFRLASLAPDAPPAPAMHAILRAIIIRRTRAEVGSAHMPAGMRFPARAAPYTVRYDMPRARQHAVDQAIRTIEELALAPYNLNTYGLPELRTGAAPLLRLLLAKRLESGLPAFRQSITDLTRRLTGFREALDRGFLRPPGNHSRRETGDQLLLEELLYMPIPAGTDRNRLANDNDADLERLHALTATLSDSDNDPKQQALEQLLFNTLAGQRVLVFSEFKDTAAHLWRSFRFRGGVAAIHGNGAWLGNAPASRTEILRRFAPRANNAPEPRPHEAVRILIATDVLAEGLNLQDAAHVVSYDLPWNPVRLIQRVGRIDRLGSPHDTIHAYHFLPDAGLERLLGLVERLRQKLAAIRLGLATPHNRASTTRWNTAASTETPIEPDTRSIVERLANGDPSLLDDLEQLDTAHLENNTRLRQQWERMTHREPPLADSDAANPNRHGPITLAANLHTHAPTATSPAALVALAVHGSTRLFEVHDNGTTTAAEQSASTILCHALGDRLAEHSASTDRTPDRMDIQENDSGESGKKPTIPEKEEHTRIRRYIQQASRFARPQSPTITRSRNSGPATAALRRLRLTAASSPGGPDPSLCHRIDRITAALAPGLRAGHEAALNELLTRWHWDPPTNALTICYQIETALDQTNFPPPHPSPASPTIRPIAILLLT